jgi:hypothetical protein
MCHHALTKVTALTANVGRGFRKKKWEHAMKTKIDVAATTAVAELGEVLVSDAESGNPVPSRQYRSAALERYKKLVDGFLVNVCVMCGFGIPAVLEVAHLDQKRSNNDVGNLAVLCPNCHKMHDLGLIPTEVVRTMRDYEAQPNWALAMKDAGAKAGLTKKRSGVANRAAATRKKNKAAVA